jgi:CubicO group peptidase (beta-lactamase class C family)
MFKHFLLKAVAVFAGFASLVTTNTASAGILTDEKNLAWASQRDLTSQQFSNAFDEYRQQGYMMIDIDAYPDDNGVRYAMIWQENKDKRGWAEHRDMTSDGYHEKWEEYKAKGFRPLDVEAYQSGSQLKWAGIWVQNKEGFAWSSHRGLDSDAYGKLFNEKTQAGFRLADMEVYNTTDGLRYAAIWYQNTDNRSWAQLRGMTREKYQEEVDKRSAQGMHVVDFESYQTSGGQRYAAIWEYKQGFGWQTRTDRTEKQFANLWRQYRDEGYRLVDFERYSTPNGPRYAGIWMENDSSRFRYSRKNQIDGIIETYRRDNNLPGISVAIIRNGQMIYRRGFGSADINDNKVAHGETIYNSASVSKVIGGTLAAKLEDEGELRNGTMFDLDLTQPTSTYLTNVANANGRGTVSLPTFHKHTVEQLLSHLSCVAHYPSQTTPGISNQTTHYPTAMAAVQNIWNTGLVTQTSNGGSCTIGTTWSYSTPAFTFAGAVLESVTGQTINQLLQNEIFTPYGLSSMRIQYASSTLPSDYDRATPYDNNNNEVSYTNSSWKVLGGGIETHAVDLARFGWKVLNAEILSADARDNRLWTRVNPNQTHGLGWSVTNDNNSRRTAEWNGSWTGARSFLRAYRDDGLVIAIMSNRTNHTVGDVGTLANNIGNEVLK